MAVQSKKESHQTEYLTTREASQFVKMAEGTLRNLVWQGEFIKGLHYVKPTSRKLLFIKHELENWLHS